MFTQEPTDIEYYLCKQCSGYGLGAVPNNVPALSIIVVMFQTFQREKVVPMKIIGIEWKLIYDGFPSAIFPVTYKKI